MFRTALFAIFTFAVTASCRSADTSDKAVPASRPARAVRMIPWFEMNIDDKQSVSDAVEGLRIWRQSTDTAIISIGYNQAGYFSTLCKQVPEMHIIPGLKTSPVLIPKGFDSILGWREIAQSINLACELTGSDTVLLENESAIKAYVEGRQQYSWSALKDGLRELPLKYNILWYPSAGDEADRLDRYVRLCEAVQEVCNVQFVDHASLFAPKFVGGKGVKNVVSRLEALAAKPPLQLIYCIYSKANPPEPNMWPLERIPEALQLVRGEDVIIYPGEWAWIPAAKTMARLRPLSPTTTTAPAGR